MNNTCERRRNALFLGDAGNPYWKLPPAYCLSGCFIVNRRWTHNGGVLMGRTLADYRLSVCADLHIFTLHHAVVIISPPCP